MVRHDRAVILGAVTIVVLLAGGYTFLGAGMDTPAPGMTVFPRADQAQMQNLLAVEWTYSYFLLIFLMWWIMMIAMMTPSAVPTLLLFAALKRSSTQPRNAPRETGKFLAGYLLAWAAFSIAAASAQWALQLGGYISVRMMTLNSGLFAAGVLILAGGYQFSGVKHACLKRCRSPVQFLTDHRRTGRFGAFMMGAHHGTFCLGCCWALMALLFVGGIMNLYWIVGLGVYVLLEKLVPFGHVVSRVAGFALVIYGLYFLYAAMPFAS